MDFLELEAYLGGDFLHPGGKALTHLLLHKFAMPAGGFALDLGCGTGAIAALMARDGGMRVIGLDRAPEMLYAAHARVRNERSGEMICFVRGNADDTLPFIDNSFHVLYAESVLALVDPARAIGECARVLQAGGQLVLVERIWKPGLFRPVVDNVNAISQQVFGIPAATREALDRDDWLQLLSSAGRDGPQAVRVDALISGRRPALELRRRIRRLRRYLRRPSYCVALDELQARHPPAPCPMALPGKLSFCGSEACQHMFERASRNHHFRRVQLDGVVAGLDSFRRPTKSVIQ